MSWRRRGIRGLRLEHQVGFPASAIKVHRSRVRPRTLLPIPDPPPPPSLSFVVVVAMDRSWFISEHNVSDKRRFDDGREELSD